MQAIKMAPFVPSSGSGPKGVHKDTTNLKITWDTQYTEQCGALFRHVGNELLPIRQIARVIIYRLDIYQKPLFLLLFNGKHKYWQNPQGGVDPGEDYKQAGAREVQEETGLETVDFVDNSYEMAQYRSIRKGNAQWCIVHGIAAQTTKTDIVLNEEDGHTEYGRFDYRQTCDRLTRFPEQLVLFQEVCKKAGLI